MIGTMVLVLMGCGAAVSLGCDPVNNQAAVVGTAMAFGLSVVAMAYAIGVSQVATSTRQLYLVYS